MKKHLIIVCLVLYASFVFSQLTVQNGFNAQQLGNNLAGSNISVSNASITGNGIQYGIFHYNGTGFPLSSGIVLSSGSIFDTPGPNSSPSTSTDVGGAGNALLDQVAGVPTHDAVEFKFDFTVQTDKIEFNYIFASEEYNEYVGSPFNDVFAFFISGPGITGEENIALVPNTSVAVAINNINLDNYWQYYNNNESGTTNIEFDGYTTVLTAKKTGLIPCQTYTLKLIIADASDGVFDSGVFLQENSLVQGPISASANTYSENNIALEGCINASFTFSLDSVKTTNTYINYSIGGTATNGIDYSHIDSVLVIPAGQTAATIIIDAYSDGIVEGQESVELYYEPLPCQGYDTIRMYIEDYQMLEFQTIPTDLSCFGSNDGQIDFNITGGQSPYTINITDSASGIVTTYNSFPITGIEEGTYQIQILDAYGCWAEDIVAGAVFDADTTFLPDGNGVSYSTSINISGLSAGQTLQSIEQLQSVCLEMEHSFMGDLLIQLQTPNGTIITLKEQPGGSTTNLGEPVASGPNDSHSEILTPGVGYQYCFTANPTYGTMVDESHSHTYTYIAQDGTTQTDKYLPAGSYQSFDPLTNLIGTPLNGNWTIIVTDEIPNNNGYIFNWSISIAADRPDSIVTIHQPQEPTITESKTLPTCGLNNGAISLTISGGISPYTYHWNTGETTQNITNAAAGIHYVTITDATGCAFTRTISLPNSSAATISSVVTNESCTGSNNGSINITISGGTTPYSFLWSGGQTTEDVSMLSPGQYNVQVTDASACISSASYIINAANPLYISGEVINESCGNMSGSIDISVLGGQSPYTYLWSNSLTTQDIGSLQQGTYTVTVKDYNNCTLSKSFSVINLVGNCIPDCDLALQNSVLTNETCGNSNGSIQLSVFTSNLPYFVSWSNGSSTTNLTGINEGTYSCTISDAENCSVEQTFQISNIAGTLEIANATTNDEHCGNGDGTIDITPSGGVLPYSFHWSTGSTSEDLSGLAEGIYDLTVSDANSCSIHETYTINNNTGSLQLIYGNVMNADCGLSNGSIDISIYGGTYPVSYHWSTNATTQDIINLAPGTYTCTITDGSGCSLVTPDYIVNTNSGTMAFSYIHINNEVCGNANGNIQILVTGGTSPYSYAWSTGATTQNIYNLSAGNYSCTVTGQNGCSITSGNITLNNLPGTLNLGNVTTFNEICSNNQGAIYLSIEGGTQPYSFHWNTGSSTQNIYNLAEGVYTCLVSDSSGCSFNVDATILNETGTLNIENFVTTNETCGNGTGSINLIISGASVPVTYIWSSGQTTEDIVNLHAGDYSVSITDSQGCSITGATHITNQTGSLTVAISSVGNEICGASTGFINITVSGGTQPYTYNWSNGAATEDILNIHAGTYSCSITDAVGCIINTGNIIINNSAGGLSISNATITNENCNNNNGAINITITGGTAPVSYLWNNSATTQDIAGLDAGTYSVVVSDANNCSVTGNYTVSQTSGTLAISSINATDEICNGNNGSIIISVTGGTTPYSYSWSNGATTQNLTALNEGIYSLNITDASSCVLNSGPITISNNPGNFSIYSISESPESCGNNNGAVNISLTGGANPISYTWSNGVHTQNISGLSAGVYSCTATDNSGCTLHLSAVVQNDAGTLVATGNITDAFCGNQNGIIDLTVTGGVSPYTYIWNNGSTTQDISGLSGGTYTVYMQDANGCSLNQSFNIYSSGAIVVTSTNVADEYCGNSMGEIQLIVSGGTSPYHYTWDNNDSPVSSCEYSLVMNDASGNGWDGAYIYVIVNGNVVGYYQPVGTSSTQLIPVNTGDVIELYYYSGWGDYENTYSLINSEGQTIYSDGPSPAEGYSYSGMAVCSFNPPDSNHLTGLSEGNYDVTITDANGCLGYASVAVNNNTGNFEISAVSVTNDFCNSTTGAINITVSGGSLPYSYLWSNGSYTQDISGLSEGNYIVNITDANGCKIIESYNVMNLTGSLEFDTAIVSNTYCGSINGAIDITVNGDEVPLTFNWSNGATTEDLNNLLSGNYSVTITDATGCSIHDSYEITNQTNGLTMDFSVVQPTCGSNNGSIDMTISGGISPYSVLWSGGETTEDLMDISSGSYTVTVTDASSCSDFETILLDNSNMPTITSVSVSNEYCGQSDGSINLSVSGGTAPLSYQWTIVNSNPCCEYSLYLYDDMGVPWDGSYLDVYINGSLYGSFTCYSGSYDYTSIPLCTGDEIQLVYTAGTNDDNNYIYLLDYNGNYVYYAGPYIDSGTLYTGTSSCSGTFPNSNYIYYISAGDYAVTITDANGCSTSDTITVLNNTNGFVISSANVTDDYCNTSSGAIDISVSGGMQPYYYYWSTGQYSEDQSGLSQGSYTVSVYDYNYCMIEETYTVGYNPGTLAFGTPTITDTYCGSPNGAINIAVNGDETPFVYTWSNGVTTEDISNVISGPYSVTVNDASGCTISNSYEIINTTNGLTVSSSVLQPGCSSSDGAIDLTISGGTSPYSVIWNTGATTEDLTGISSGQYVATITDASSCSTYEYISLNPSNMITLNSVSINHEYCGQSNGSINIAATGGSMPYTYQWGLANSSQCCEYAMYLWNENGIAWNGSTVDIFINGALYGTYTFNGGSYFYTTIPVCTNDFVQLNYSENASDYGNDVYLLDANGNNIFYYSPYNNSETSYLGVASCSANFPNSSYISGLSEGQYSVTITNAEGCSLIETFTINNNTGGFDFSSINKTDDYCNTNSGAIDISVTGGFSPYMYYWSNGESTEDISGLAEGTYTISVYDQNYCLIQESVTINYDPGTLSIATPTITDTYCGNSSGAINITATGNYPPFAFNWSNGATTEDISGISSGDYTVTVYDNNGCHIQDSFTIQNQTNGLLVTSTTTNAYCGNNMGSINLTISGGISPYSVLWNNGSVSEDLSGLPQGTYIAEITDASGCQTIETVVVNDLGLVSINNLVVNDEICDNNEGSIFVYATGGTLPYTYSWSQTATNNCCSYILEMYDSFGDGWNGGYLTVYINGTSMGVFSASGTNSTEQFDVCNGDQIALYYVSGSWEEENTYYLYNSAGGEIFSDGPYPTAGNAYSGTTSCDFSAPNTNYLTGLNAGDYNLTITEASGCSLDTTITINNSSGNFNISSVNITDDNCGNFTGAIDITITGGTLPYNFYWNNNSTTEDLSNISAGNYLVTVYDNNGCELLGSYDVQNQSGSLAIIDSIITGTYCGNNSGAINITVTGGTTPYSFLWSNGSTSEDLSGILSGNYTITVTDNSNCKIIYSFVVPNQTNGLLVNYTAENETCGNNSGSITLNISGGSAPYTIHWNTGATTQNLTGLAAGNYSYTVTDNTGCSSSDAVTIINYQDNLSIILDNIQNDYCNWGYGAINISISGGTAPYTYYWSNGYNTQDISYVMAGTYTVTVYDSNGCSDIESFEIGYQATFVVTDTLIQNASCATCPDGFIDLTVNSIVVTYQWSNSQTTQDIYNLSPGNYTVTMTDDYGCTLVETYNVSYPINNIVSNQKSDIINIFPNPSKGNIYVNLDLLNNADVTIEVFNVLGENVLTTKPQQIKKGTISVDLSNFINGAYSIHVNYGETNFIKRVILMNE